jgi:hypothetical protein
VTTALTHHGPGRPLNDEQRIGRMVTGMAAVFGVTLTDPRLHGYVQALTDLPLDALQVGIKRAIATWRFPDMPKPADIRTAVEAELVASREAAQRQQLAAARAAQRGPFTVFGRMSKASVLAHFKGFVADARCSCVACWDAQVAGPPRFVPDGVYPNAICERCTDSGWFEGDSGAVRRCACASTNPNLVEATRTHTIDMGKWLHGAELLELEQAEAAFHAALRRVGMKPEGLRDE